MPRPSGRHTPRATVGTGRRPGQKAASSQRGRA
jgi:hypothetical protein